MDAHLPTRQPEQIAVDDRGSAKEPSLTTGRSDCGNDAYDGGNCMAQSSRSRNPFNFIHSRKSS